MAAGRFQVGYPWVLVLAGLDLGMIFHSQFSVSSLVSTRGYPMDIRIKSLELIFIFYNIKIITCLLRLLNLF